MELRISLPAVPTGIDIAPARAATIDIAPARAATITAATETLDNIRIGNDDPVDAPYRCGLERIGDAASAAAGGFEIRRILRMPRFCSSTCRTLHFHALAGDRKASINLVPSILV